MSMLSAQRDELRKCADALQATIDSLNLGHITHEGLTDALHYGINDLRSAADTIWELRNKMCDMVDVRERARVLEAENDKLRELARAAWKCIHVGASCSDCRLIAGGCTLQTAMRELGIEVTP